MYTTLNAIRVITTTAFLVYASVQDVKKREVENTPWLLMGLIGFALIFFMLYSSNATLYAYLMLPLPLTLFFDAVIDREGSKHELVALVLCYLASAMTFAYALSALGLTDTSSTILSIVFMLLLAYGLYYAGALHGGADAKAIMSIAVLTPTPPVFGPLPLLADSLVPAFPVALLTLFYAAVALIVVLPPYFFAYNALQRNYAFPQMLFGTIRPLGALKFWWPMEIVSDGGKIKLCLLPRRGLDYDKVVARLRELGKNSVWATPKIPFLVAILIGYGLAITLGNILYVAFTCLIQFFINR